MQIKAQISRMHHLYEHILSDIFAYQRIYLTGIPFGPPCEIHLRAGTVPLLQ